MYPAVPVYLSILFVLSTLYVLWGVAFTIRSHPTPRIRKKMVSVVIVLVLWLTLQGALAGWGVYAENLDHLPPRIFAFGVLPPIVLILAVFLTRRGRSIIDGLSLRRITYLHIVRIPVEVVLYGLYIFDAIPRELTFEGWNYDLIMGLTAPLVLILGWRPEARSRLFFVLWNVVGIGLLAFVFVLAVLSAPFPLQQFGFTQPNVGLLHFPFVWLPTFIVPVVISGHLIALRRWWIGKQGIAP